MKKLFTLVALLVAMVCVIASCGHTHYYAEWETIKQPTCSENGEKVRYCTCGEKQNEILLATGHNYVDGVCENCGDENSADTPILPDNPACQHTEVDILAAVEPTCTETGLTEGSECSVCGEVLVAQTVVDALGHTEVVDVAVEATCTSTGLTEGKHCSVCGEFFVKQTETPIILHTYTDNYDESCNVCGFIRDAECAHTNVTILPAKDATCIETGSTEGIACSKCQEILQPQTVIPAKGHAEVIDAGVEATCTTAGKTEGKHCSTCNEVIVEQSVIDAKGHTKGEKQYINDDCPCMDREFVINCIICEKNIENGIDDGIGHSYTKYELVKYDPEVTGVPVCEMVPLEVAKCDNCSCYACISVREVGPAPGHNYFEGVCDVCGKVDPNYTSIIKGVIYNVSSDGTYAEVVGYDGAASAVVIEDEYQGLPVTSISSSAFEGKTITTVVIPDSITNIFSYAFKDCTSLLSIDIPDSVINLGWGAFSGCYSLESVVIGDGLTFLESEVFGSCTSLKNITIGEGITHIETYAFAWYESNKNVYVNDINQWFNIEFCGAGSYYLNDVNLFVNGVPAQNVQMIIPSGTTEVSLYNTRSCKELVSVLIPDSVNQINWGVFSNSSLLSTIYYEGSEDTWSEIYISTDNIYLNSATRYYYSESEPTTEGNFWHYVDGVPTVWDAYVAPVTPTYSEGLEYTSNDDGTCYVSGIGDCSDMHIIIPEVSPDGLKVVAIGDSAFFGCRGFEYITIPNSVTRIGDSALSYCTSLKSVAISDSVTYIGKSAFYYSDNLTSVYIPAGVTYIGDSAFSYCWINNISVSEENQHYKDIDGNLYTKDSKKLLQYSIAKRETEFVIPDGVTHIGSEAFGYNSYITSVIIPESVTHIGNNAFSECYELVNLVIPPNVVEIGHGAFAYCKFTSCVIPDGVASIGSSTFMGCSALASIVIPESVTSIGEYAFYWCNALNDVYYTASEYLWNKIAIASFCNDSLSKANIHFNYGKPAYSLGLEYTSNGNGTCYVSDIGLCSDTDIIIPEISPDGLPVTGIGASAFYNCSNLTSVSIPDSVISIGGHAFYCCTGLYEIMIPNGVTTIGYQAFGNCTGLASIILPDSITSLGDRAFFNCTGITKITLPNRITAVSDELFMSCTGLTDITIPDAVTTIGIGAFWDCSALANVTIPKSVTVIDEMAFAGCTALTSIIIPDGVTSIGYQAFSGCSGLGEINIPDSVNTIGGYAFNGCFALTSAIINGNGTTQIGSNAFASCSKLSSLVIGDGVKTISDGAFIRCFSLTSVVFDDSVTHVGYQAFEYCSNIADVYYTGNESAWGNINFESYNECLTDATIQFNYVLN